MGRIPQAVFAWCEALAIAPNDNDLRMQYAALLIRLGQIPAAMEQFEDVVSREPANSRGQLGVGLCAFQLADFSECVVRTKRALELDPMLSPARIFLARGAIGLHDYEYAASVLMPLHPDSQSLSAEDANEYAIACIAVGDFEHAEAALQHAIRLSPGDQAVRTNLALICERGNRIDEAANWLAGLKQRDSNARMLAPQLMARRGRFDEALKGFDLLLKYPHGLSQSDIAQVEFERGRCLDQLGRYSEAFDTLVRANERDRREFLALHPGRIRKLGDYPWLLDDPAADLKPTDTDNGNGTTELSPIFLVGFPRSGTTLLDQMLDAHPALAVIEEKPLVEAAMQTMARLGAEVSVSSRLEQGREAYWNAARAISTFDPGLQMVDKFPLNLARAQTIKALFPNARWIFAIRHPADVVLSCFMQRFRFTDSTQGFWDLQSIASIYDSSLNLWLLQRQRLELRCYDIRYEMLVADPEISARKLFEFLDLEWDSSVLETAARARTRWVATPSYAQVAQPINTRAVGRWLRYRSQLDSVMPTVQRWASRLGYPPT